MADRSSPDSDPGNDIAILLLAAGGSTRMRGRDKLLEPVEGEPLLRHCARAAADSRAQRVIVVLRPDDADRRAALRGLGVSIMENHAWREGMASSIRAGIAACANAAAAIVALADMPEIGAPQLDALITRFDPLRPRILRACAPNGRPGNPVLFPRACFDALAALRGDSGARDLLKRLGETTDLVEITGAGTDLDTPEDWADWRARHASGAAPRARD